MRTEKYGIAGAKSAAPTAPLPLRGSIPELLRQAAVLGYRGVEVHMQAGDPCDPAEVYASVEETGVRIAAIATGRLYTEAGLSLLDDRPYIAREASLGMRQYIALAAKLRTNLVLGWAIGRMPEGGSRSAYLARLAAALKPLCGEAAAAGVRIFIEVINRYEVNLITTAQAALDLIESFLLPNCYVHLDTFHMGIEESDPYAAMRACGSKLGYFHVADNTRKYPGSGQLDFARYLQTLHEIAYTGFITVECLPWPDGTAAAKRAIMHLQKCEQQQEVQR